LRPVVHDPAAGNDIQVRKPWDAPRDAQIGSDQVRLLQVLIGEGEPFPNASALNIDDAHIRLSLTAARRRPAARRQAWPVIGLDCCYRARDFSEAYGAAAGSANYNAAFDFGGAGANINNIDARDFSLRYGQTFSSVLPAGRIN